ncbi:hypothetical protein AB664_19850 [Brucella anthropi]|uniref:Uncharacterized protein n=1 Tax=Brucella anthropi TaxID=529 RepID=A0A656Z263_BRUAN|nr:hypothetical protein AB664_19850 [Brucella anthropi]
MESDTQYVSRQSELIRAQVGDLATEHQVATKLFEVDVESKVWRAFGFVDAALSDPTSFSNSTGLHGDCPCPLKRLK